MTHNGGYLLDRQKPRGILARMKKLEAKVRAVGRRVNTFATSAGDSIAELSDKFEHLAGEVSRLKTKVTAIDLWRHKLPKTPDRLPKSED